MPIPPAASAYAQLRQYARVRERDLFPPRRTPTEIELQARWFAGDFGRTFRTIGGDEVEIVQFGTWNREAGPDFSEAAIRLNHGKPLRGSIEFDLVDRNWEWHGHATNPAFEETVLHVFVEANGPEFFSRTKSHRNVPQVRVDPSALPENFSANIPLARPGRCQAPLKGLPEARVGGVIEAAAQFRLQRKAAHLRHVADCHGWKAALFQELAGALGYKQNKLPFILLAQRLPVKLLHKNPADREALLFGLAGFLESPDLGLYQPDVRSYLRNLWDRWWPYRDKMQRLVLPAKLWRLGGGRPLNHPQRRLGALALLAQKWPAFFRSLGKPCAPGAAADFLRSLQHPFWDRHYTLTSAASPKPMALIGHSRIAEILANVVFPFLRTEGKEMWGDYKELRAQLSNRRLQTGATRLFGSDPRRLLFLKTVAHQQGLLQIYEDFCLQDNSDCAQCPFPEQMRAWK